MTTQYWELGIAYAVHLDYSVQVGGLLVQEGQRPTLLLAKCNEDIVLLPTVIPCFVFIIFSNLVFALLAHTHNVS